eukprot:PLAT2482.18.p2 GENE.PLAT2482.18~~PLAT2482.18.p2  ORF type:complete len:337 (-),score=166.61 PLAT2482.18:31-1041(-)
MPSDTSHRPDDTDFKQQRLKAWQPILTPVWVISTFFGIGVIFIILGVVLMGASNSVVETCVQYGGTKDSMSGCTWKAGCNATVSGTPCTVEMTAPAEMKAPIYVYYELDNFFQNHRRYVKSRSDAQLQGEKVSDTDLQDACSPKYKGEDGKILWPCGLIANSYFNDDIELTTAGYTMMEDDIAWPSDKAAKFKNQPAADVDPEKYQYLNTTYPGYAQEAAAAGLKGGVENEHFIVWMRTAGLPRFRKLYGRIEKDIPKDKKITFSIDSKFAVKPFDGGKALVMTTTSWLGGKNPFLGTAYLVVGIICLVLAIIFFAKQQIRPRKLGDPAFLQWRHE